MINKLVIFFRTSVHIVVVMVAFHASYSYLVHKMCIKMYIKICNNRVNNPKIMRQYSMSAMSKYS